jgi:hypothetical protein
VPAKASIRLGWVGPGCWSDRVACMVMFLKG